MTMPGRGYNAGSYRYGFNGKERDPNISVEDYDFGARIYDGRIGRWLSVDPLQNQFPSESPYLFGGGNPIIFVDQGGRRKELYITVIDKSGKSTTIKVVNKNYIKYSVAHGYNNATYYKSDVQQNVIIDLRNNTMVNSPEISVNKKEISTLDFAINYPRGIVDELFGEDPNSRSKQPGGIKLLSEFSDEDGAKTDVTEEASLSINVDLLVAAIAGVSNFADLPRNVELVDQLKSVIEKGQEVKEKIEANSGKESHEMDKSKALHPKVYFKNGRQVDSAGGSTLKAGSDITKPDTIIVN